MNEEFLNYLWLNKLLEFKKLSIKDSAESIDIIDAGSRNTDSGPDFFNAKIKIDSTIWAGNIEVHVKSSDWKMHKHQKDISYDNIILHVVYEDDLPVIRNNGERIPTIELKNAFDPQILLTYKSFIRNTSWIPCEQQLINIDHFTQIAWLENLCIERLEEKARKIEEHLEITKQDFQEIFYRRLCRSFGFNTNGDAFELLAKSLPFQIVSKHINMPDQLEALFYGQGGMLKKSYKDNYPLSLKQEYEFLSLKYGLIPLDRKIWKFLRMRPSNFPTIRISQFASLIQSASGLLLNIIECNTLSDARLLFKVNATNYWQDHSDFDRLSKTKSTRLGDSSIDLIFINTIIPFTFIYGKIFKSTEFQEKAISWYEQIKPEKNHIITKFLELGLKIDNAKQSQAAIQLKKNYCDKKKCLNCRFGHTLISKKM